MKFEVKEEEGKTKESGGNVGKRGKVTSGSMSQENIEQRWREPSCAHMLGWSQRVSVEGPVLLGKHWPFSAAPQPVLKMPSGARGFQDEKVCI